MIGKVWTKATNDGGVYYLEDGVLCYAPQNLDGSVDWAGGAQVALDCIDEYLVPEAKRAEDLLRKTHFWTLVQEWERWCRAEGLDVVCAQEMLSEDLTPAQRAYVESFVEAWDQRAVA